MDRSLIDVLSDYRHLLTHRESCYLSLTFDSYGGCPGLRDLWMLMDQAWIESQCDVDEPGHRLAVFYRHPVWLLNGLHSLYDQQCKLDRERLLQAISPYSPMRILDYGGGFGNLARSVASSLPNSIIHVLEPYPHPLAIELSKQHDNIDFVGSVESAYDMVIASDVFEHLEDPIHAASDCAHVLANDGLLLVANCFSPVILCHLPRNFHMEYSWTSIMTAMGLVEVEANSRFSLHRKSSSLSLSSARREEAVSRALFPYIRAFTALLPRGKKKAGTMLYNSLRLAALR